MNIKALVTMLVLGSSSVAMARPVAVSGHAGASIVVRDHRADGAPPPVRVYRPEPAGSLHSPPPFVPQWVTLGTERRFIDRGEMTFHVRPSMRAFSALKLQTLSGKTLVYRVEIRFTNGRTQVVELNQYLNSRNPTIAIDLAGDRSRSIRNITVVGRNARQSQYSVLAI